MIQLKTPKGYHHSPLKHLHFVQLRKLSVSVNKHDEDAEVMPALPLPDIPAAPAPAAVKARTWMS